MINLFEKFLLNLNLKMQAAEKEVENRDYESFSFFVNNFYVKFRTAKITPTKEGSFVAFYKRNELTKIIEPYDYNDKFDFLVIATNKNSYYGFFIFPFSILFSKHIISSDKKEGKRAFRVYSAWDKPNNSQAINSKKWQSEFFIDCSLPNQQSYEKIKSLFIS